MWIIAVIFICLVNYIIILLTYKDKQMKKAIEILKNYGATVNQFGIISNLPDDFETAYGMEDELSDIGFEITGDKLVEFDH